MKPVTVRPLLASALVAAAITGGCAQPLAIAQIDSAQNEIQFVVRRGSAHTTLLCQQAADGALSGCRTRTPTAQK